MFLFYVGNVKAMENMKKNKLELIFNVKPISKDNYRAAVPIKKGNKYICIPRLDDYYKEYEDCLAQEAIEQMEIQGIKNIIEDEIFVEKLVFYFNRKPTQMDFFNFGKSLFDSLNGIVYKDDSQIQGFNGMGWKTKDKENPRIELTIRW